jgi:PPOX class probable F420-dependent enzyme
MPATFPESYRDLFRKKSIAYLALHTKDDGIMVNPVWIAFDGENLVINSVQGRVKDKLMRKNPGVTLCVTDPDNPFRYVEVRGKVIQITTEGAEENIDHLSERYMGITPYPYRKPGDVRVLYRIQPQKVVPFGM